MSFSQSYSQSSTRVIRQSLVNPQTGQEATGMVSAATKKIWQRRSFGGEDELAPARPLKRVADRPPSQQDMRQDSKRIRCEPSVVVRPTARIPNLTSAFKAAKEKGRERTAQERRNIAPRNTTRAPIAKENITASGGVRQIKAAVPMTFVPPVPERRQSSLPTGRLSLGGRTSAIQPARQPLLQRNGSTSHLPAPTHNSTFNPFGEHPKPASTRKPASDLNTANLLKRQRSRVSEANSLVMNRTSSADTMVISPQNSDRRMTRSAAKVARQQEERASSFASSTDGMVLSSPSQRMERMTLSSPATCKENELPEVESPNPSENSETSEYSNGTNNFPSEMLATREKHVAPAFPPQNPGYKVEVESSFEMHDASFASIPETCNDTSPTPSRLPLREVLPAQTSKYNPRSFFKGSSAELSQQQKLKPPVKVPVPHPDDEYAEEHAAADRAAMQRMCSIDLRSPRPFTKDQRFFTVDEFARIHSKLKCNPEVLFSGIRILDIFLSRWNLVKYYGQFKAIWNDRLLKLSAFASLSLAVKADSQRHPCAFHKIVHQIIPDATPTEMVSLETTILQLVGECIFPTPLSFLRKLDGKTRFEKRYHEIAKYLCEVSLYDMKFNCVPPSMLAASANYLARRVLNGEKWNKHLDDVSGVRESEKMLSIARALIVAVHDQERMGKQEGYRPTIFRKYAADEYGYAAPVFASHLQFFDIESI
ncbi:hypothetical protein DFS34DRAFT_602220 [Phlyctochytrium arcticum]|nr:hypothetical protein DFS34DRAFT_602220 [Phlyctochytrium arcticum]